MAPELAKVLADEVAGVALPGEALVRLLPDDEPRLPLELLCAAALGPKPNNRTKPSVRAVITRMALGNLICLDTVGD